MTNETLIQRKRNTSLLNQIKSFMGSPTTMDTANIHRSVLQFILLFAVFYFAIFEYSVSPHEIVSGVIEFCLVAISQCITLTIFLLMGSWRSRVQKKPFTLCYGKLFPIFLACYTCGMAIMYPMKQFIWDIQKDWFWKYYWRHLPFALLIICIFLIREYKNARIEALTAQLNLRLRDSIQQKVTINGTDKVEIPLQILVNGITKTVAPSAITHITVNGHYLDLYYSVDQGYEHICIRKSLNEVMEELPPDMFLRTHRSHIANPTHITGLTRHNRQYSATLCEGRFTIPISRNNLPHVVSFLENRLSS